jgi:hypothetical protein
MKTHTLETAEADIVHDVKGPLPTAVGRPPLFMIGQPMDASGFRTLASHFPNRTVITYDPRRSRSQHPQRRPDRQRTHRPSGRCARAHETERAEDTMTTTPGNASSNLPGALSSRRRSSTANGAPSTTLSARTVHWVA